MAFHYHMYGADMGELNVTNAAGEAVWSLSGDQGNAWQAVSVGVFSASFAFEYTQRYTATGNEGFRGNAAVAQVTVSCGAAPLAVAVGAVLVAHVFVLVPTISPRQVYFTL